MAYNVLNIRESSCKLLSTLTKNEEYDHLLGFIAGVCVCACLCLSRTYLFSSWGYPGTSFLIFDKRVQATLSEE